MCKCARPAHIASEWESILYFLEENPHKVDWVVDWVHEVASVCRSFLATRRFAANQKYASCLVARTLVCASPSPSPDSFDADDMVVLCASINEEKESESSGSESDSSNSNSTFSGSDSSDEEPVTPPKKARAEETLKPSMKVSKKRETEASSDDDKPLNIMKKFWLRQTGSG